jgi:predicted nuclease of predicted toxin-antitoxin system
MRFLVDECTGQAVARWLRARGYDTLSIYESARGSTDDEVVQRAFAENRILITNDKDFGEKVYREGWPHHGIILLRLADERAANKIAVVEKLLDSHQSVLAGRFVVVTETRIRVT